MPPIPNASAPAGGWWRPGAPHDRLLGLDLGVLDEEELLPPSGAATVYACGRSQRDYDPRRDPVVLVHGIAGAPADLQALADRLSAVPEWQLHVLAYSDVERPVRRSGDELADELRLLGAMGSGSGTLRVVAHSLGGLVTRRALSRMAGSIGLERFARVRVVAIDSPWQGFGAGNDLLDGPVYRALRDALPGGVADMHYDSTLFAGDPGSRDPVERAGLFGVRLPDKVELELVFARGDSPAATWASPRMASLLSSVAAHYARDTEVEGSAEQLNFWRAITDSAQFNALAARLRVAGEAGLHDEGGVRSAFEALYPRFGGDHGGCLHEQPPGAPSLPAAIVELLR